MSWTKDICSANRLTIIKHVLNKKQISRAYISEETGLNKTTVPTIVKKWMNLKLAEETTMGDSNGGQPPIILTLATKMSYYIAVDIRARRTGLIFTDLNDDIVSCRSLFIEKEMLSYVYQQIYVATDKVIREIPPYPYGLIGTSLTVREIIDLDGVIRLVPKLQWHNVDIKSLLGQRCSVPVYIDNDGSLVASMESHLHPQYEELTVLCISDVISCGMTSNGQLICGCLGFANAARHHTINTQEAKQCSCGKYGCWEQYCSSQYLLDEISLRLGEPLKGVSELIEPVKKQHPSALAILDTHIRNLAIGLSNIMLFADYEMIILNSHLIQSLPYLLPETTKDIVLPITRAQEILTSSFGNEGSILGASLKTIKEFLEILSAHG